VAPLSPQRFVLQVTVGQATHDKLRHAQALLGHQIPSRDVAQVLDRALDALIQKLERQKLAATAKPRRTQRPTASRRHIPARVRRAVWERDQGQCTYVSEAGRRCGSRTRLEFDHVDEVARGGKATVEGIRLRCRAHNQYAAECTFGTEFMHHKRQEAAARAAEARTAKAGQLAARPVGAVPEDRDVVPWLRQLGSSAREARSAAGLCSGLHDAPLEERVRAALRSFHPRAHAAVRRG
jgi:5-methylcytosine-specific restriction endonuclease McrA